MISESKSSMLSIIATDHPSILFTLDVEQHSKSDTIVGPESSSDEVSWRPVFGSSPPADIYIRRKEGVLCLGLTGTKEGPLRQQPGWVGNGPYGDPVTTVTARVGEKWMQAHWSLTVALLGSEWSHFVGPFGAIPIRVIFHRTPLKLTSFFDLGECFARVRPVDEGGRCDVRS